MPVVGNAELVELVEHGADVLVMIDHGIVVGALPASGLAQALRLHMGTEVHVSEVHPGEERLTGLVLLLDERCRPGGHVVIDGLHALLGERAGVLDTPVGPAVDHTLRSELLPELGILRIVRQLRLLFGVQVIEVAVELVEAVHGRQHLGPVAQVVLSKLTRGIAVRLEQPGDRGVFLLHAEIGPGHSHLAEARPEDALAHDEGRTTSRAALLGVVVREDHSFIGDAIDVGRLVAHHALGVRADVALPDVVAPDDDDVGF